MKPFYFPTPIEDTERLVLLDWVLENHDKSFFKDAKMRGNRITTRYTDEQHFCFPEEATKIRNKIADALEFSKNPLPHFSNGMVASYALPGDTCYAHRDPRWYPSLWTVHCNVILSPPESGGDLFIENVQYEMPTGQPICYPVSEMTHQTTLIKGEKPRIMWIFGFCVSPTEYLNAQEKFK